MTTPYFSKGFIEFYPADGISTVQHLRDSVPWENRDAPRDECFMAIDTKLTYSYGRSAAVRRTYYAKEMTDTVRTCLETLNTVFKSSYNVCVLNYYKDRHNHLGWHADDSPEQDPTHPIAVLSFGAERYLYVRENGFTGNVPEENKFLLTEGSVFIMPPGYQETHQHKIPKHDRECGARISMTFRKLDR